jgi:hypothetical protein
MDVVSVVDGGALYVVIDCGVGMHVAAGKANPVVITEWQTPIAKIPS